MKALLLLACAVTFSFHLHAQGTVNFASGAAGVNAPAYVGFIGGPLASPATAGGTYLAMLYAGPAGSTESALSSTIVSGAPIAIGTTSPGYFFGGARTIAGIPSGSAAMLQIRMWWDGLGSTWEAAGGPGGAPYTGKTAPITLTLGGGPTPTPNMVGLTAFALPPIPEPGTWALVLLGLGCVVFKFRSATRYR